MTYHEVPRPESAPLQALLGEISPPVIINSVPVRLVTEGAGMAGLPDLHDNRDWAGLTGHTFVSARVSTYIASLLKEKGYNADPQIVLNAHLISHTGRRKHDEARTKPDHVPNAKSIVSISNEELGVNYLKSKNINPAHLEVVSALAHGHEEPVPLQEDLNFRIASYADHRCEHEVYSLGERLGNFLMGYFLNTKNMSPPEKKSLQSQVHTVFNELVQQGRKGSLTLYRATSIARGLGAPEFSERGLNISSFMQMLLDDSELEKTMIEAGINPDDISSDNPPLSRWERYLRRLFVGDALPEAHELIGKALASPANKVNLQEAQTLGGWNSWDSALRKIIKETIPQANWPAQAWAPAMIENLYVTSLIQGNSESFKSKNSTVRPLEGWARAVWFFQYLDLSPAERDGYRKLLKASK